MLHGSTVRGEALDTSDVDLAVVVAEDADPPARLHREGGLVVEVIARSEAAWSERFARPQPAWLYAFLEGEVLVDRGPGARLVAEARRRYTSYGTPPEVRAELADRLGHGRAKLERALDNPDDARAGYWASVMLVSAVPEVLYACPTAPCRHRRAASTSSTSCRSWRPTPN